MLAPWVMEEMEDVNLQDKRLNDRLSEVLAQLGGHPTASIPAACGGHAEMTAAYRFFANEKVRFDNVLAPHIEATRRRMREQSVVIHKEKLLKRVVIAVGQFSDHLLAFFFVGHIRQFP